MNKLYCLFVLFVACRVCEGQNLVPNGDFEQYSNCPYYTAQIDSALFWFNPTIYPGGGGTPDYFNQCAPNLVGVPDNYFGYQNAHSGTAYGGLLIWWGPVGNYREYIETPLTSPLVANACYHLEMHVSLANNSKRTTNEISVYLSDTAITGITNWSPFPFTPQINNSTGNIVDTSNWVLITADYTASGGENYLVIGNFKNDFNTATAIFNNAATTDMAYIYIDDVSLSLCTSIEEQNQNDEIIIYPNPVKDELFIKSNSLTGKADIKITNVLGKEIYQNRNQISNFKLQTSNLKKGIYFIEINNGKVSFRKKFLKQ